MPLDGACEGQSVGIFAVPPVALQNRSGFTLTLKDLLIVFSTPPHRPSATREITIVTYLVLGDTYGCHRISILSFIDGPGCDIGRSLTSRSDNLVGLPSKFHQLAAC